MLITTMKAREPKLKLGQIDTNSIDVCQWIREKCANYAEAAFFFGVDDSTIKRWMNGTRRPSPIAARAIALYEEIGKVA